MSFFKYVLSDYVGVYVIRVYSFTFKAFKFNQTASHKFLEVHSDRSR